MFVDPQTGIKKNWKGKLFSGAHANTQTSYVEMPRIRATPKMLPERPKFVSSVHTTSVLFRESGWRKGSAAAQKRKRKELMCSRRRKSWRISFGLPEMVYERFKNNCWRRAFTKDWSECLYPSHTPWPVADNETNMKLSKRFQYIKSLRSQWLALPHPQTPYAH